MAKNPAAPILIPILIEFQPGSQIRKISNELAPFRGVSHAADRTSVTSPDGRARAEIPTDQIVFDETTAERVCIGLGGMSFEGLEREKLVFWRVRDLVPQEELGSGAEDKVLIETSLVASLHVQGSQVWPAVRI